MPRNKQGNKNLISNMVMQNAGRRAANFDPVPMRCTAQVVIKKDCETEETRDCGCMLFDKKSYFNVFFVPEIIMQTRQGKGSVNVRPNEFFMCAECGTVYKPAEWNALARETYDKNGKSSLLVGVEKPDGKEKEGKEKS